MTWIFVIIFVAICSVLMKFVTDYADQKSVIASQGGIKTIYKQLIDGMLKIPSARMIQDKEAFVTIGGLFTDPIFKRECGWWTVIIQPTFKTLSVKYQAHHDLGGGENAKQIWDFPIDMDQNEMLTIIRKKTDEWEMYGIYKLNSID